MADRLGSGVRHLEVAADDDGMRLDRWLRGQVPDLPQGRLEKLLRTGQIRVDGGRARAALRLAAGQAVRLPPMAPPAAPPVPAAAEALRHKPDPAMIRELQGRVLHLDDDILVLDKPRGLAVQGGTRIRTHLDAMADGLRFGAAEAPRLVHRLDRETSGVLVMARSAKAARTLSSSFRGHSVIKEYWALVVGVPEERRGRIDRPVGRGPDGSKRAGPGADARLQRAISHYRVIDTAGSQAAWLALWPHTGRTHQVRLHCLSLGTPIQGDGQHGGADAFLPISGLSRRLHLHARRMVLPHPGGTGPLRFDAKLPDDMAESFRYFGFDANTPTGPAP